MAAGELTLSPRDRTEVGRYLAQAPPDGTARREIPDFLVKTTLGCSAICILILIPFTVNNFIQERVALGLATVAVGVACSVNVWLGLRGRYSLAVNTYLVSLSALFTITLTMIRLPGAGSYWPFLLVLAFYFVLPERRAWFFNALTVLMIFPAAWVVLDRASALRFTAVLIGSSLFAFVSMREVNLLHDLLRQQAFRDQLTGLLNRSLLEDSVAQAVSQSQRTGIPMTLITLDIDHFKAVNDSSGHDVGDLVLQRLAELLTRNVRRTDRCFRIGGEEFLLLTYNTDERSGVEIAEKLRREVERAFASLLPGHPITVSAGVAGLENGMDAATWMKSCDEKLYRAKESGRNRVVA